MPEYTYQAKKGPSEIFRGSISAPSQQEAIRLIEEKGFIPIEVVLNGSKSSSAPAPIKKNIETKKQETESTSISKTSGVGKISSYQICIFTRQLAGFMRTSVPVLTAVELIKKQASDKNLRALLEQVTEGVRNGSSLSEAIERFGSRSFDSRYLSMIRSGESGGSLDSVLEVLADYLEKEEELRGQIKAALAYPLLIMLVGVATLFFLFIFCVPRLTQIFGQSYSTLPLPTKILLSFSHPEWQAALWITLLSIAGTISYLFFGGPKAKRKRDSLALKIPILSDLCRKSDIARFTSTLAMLIENGIPAHNAVELARPTLSNEWLRQDLKDAQKNLLEGGMLTDVMRNAKHFPPFVHQIISVGEESGQLAKTLQEVSRFYSRESLRDVKILTSLIEPIFIVGLSLIVGLIVSAIMLPIFDMNWVK